jgi:hypothetical protein
MSGGDVGGGEEIFHVGVDDDEGTVLVRGHVFGDAVGAGDLVGDEELQDALEIVMGSDGDYVTDVGREVRVGGG